jgi:hypothetical protein
MNKKLAIKSILTAKAASMFFNAARDLIVIRKMKQSKNIKGVTNELHQDFEPTS